MLANRTELTRIESPSSVFTSGCDIFTNYFYRKSILSLTVKLTEDMMNSQSYSERTVSFAKEVAYLAVVILQGSVHTSGSGYLTTTLMQRLGFSDDHAWWGGYAVSMAVCLAMDATPWGVLTTIISTAGGEFGRDAALTLYAGVKPTVSSLLMSTETMEKRC